jgi:hypothetical protein
METPTSANQFLPLKVWQTFPLLAGIFTMATIAAAIWAMGHQERSSNVQTLNDGLNTCFSRVGQSFTAKMIGDKNSEYLRSSFFSSTEDCFGEVISFTRINLASARDKQVGLSLNQLSSEVHLFHELLRPAVGFGQKDNNLVPERYAKLEQQKFQVDDALGVTKIRINKYMARLRKVVGAGAFIVGTLSLLLLIKARNKGKRRRELELIAREQIGDGQFGDVGLIQRTIVQALELMETNYLVRLAETFFYSQPRPVSASVSNDFIEKQYVTFSAPSDDKNDEQIEMIWDKFNHQEAAKIESTNSNATKNEKRNENSNQKKNLPLVEEVVLTSVSDTLAKAIDFYSAKLFSTGVLVNLDTDEVQTNIDQDFLEQIVFEAFSEVMDGIKVESSHSLNITLKKIDNVAHFSIMRCSSDWIPDNTESNHCRIIRELLADCGGELVIDDAKDSDGQLIGRSYRILFPLNANQKNAQLQNKKRLSSLKRGKKRDLLAQIN